MYSSTLPVQKKFWCSRNSWYGLTKSHPMNQFPYHTCRYLDMLEKALLLNGDGKKFFIGEQVSFSSILFYGLQQIRIRRLHWNSPASCLMAFCCEVIIIPSYPVSTYSTCTVVPLLRDPPLIKDHLTFKTTMPEDTCLGLHCFLPLIKDHPSSKTTICVNHRVVSQEGDYCNSFYSLESSLLMI